jgi:hypothetical protein
MIEFDSSQLSCTGCTDRVIYTRNHIIIRNINPADVDDAGDLGTLTSVFKKPRR